MEWTMKCDICGEKKDDYFVSFQKKKGAFIGGRCCMSCLKRILESEEDKT
jgi:hypothetical protein